MVKLFLICILTLPLLGFLINGLGRKRWNKSTVKLIAYTVILIPFMLSLLIFFKSKSYELMTYKYFDILNLTTLQLSFALKIDHLSILYINMITGIGFLIHVFSSSYMREEANHQFAKYFAYLNLFIFFMLLLVLGGNYFILFFGWEGVGLCSYFLIGFWFTNPAYNKAAKKAFIMNRIGDAAFLLAIFWIIAKLHSTDFDIVLSAESLKILTPNDIQWITLLLFIGATGKSAQIPLFTWLPDAMAGPTPVSALIHAATMVTAGIYLIVRSNVLYQLAPFTNQIILWVGIATMLMAATIALKQNDIKKILAYSTVSQLGYMFIALGLGAYSTAVFHVITHAFFKALLFLAAGSVIQALHHEQNITKMGGLKKLLPITHITFLIGCLAITGIPLFSGFFSKDEILTAMYLKSPFYFAIGVIGAIMTAIYMFRLYTIAFRGTYRNHYDIAKVKENNSAITFPLIVLAIGSILSGYIGIPAMFGNLHFLNHYLQPILKLHSIESITEHTELILMTISCGLVLLTMWIVCRKYRNFQSLKPLNRVEVFLYNKWYVDELYDFVIVKPTYWKSRFLATVLEIKIIDGFIRSIQNFILYTSRNLRLLQSGFITNYLIISILAIYLFFILWYNEVKIVQFIHKLF